MRVQFGGFHLRPFELVSSAVVVAIKALGLLGATLAAETPLAPAELWMPAFDCLAAGALTFALAWGLRTYSGRASAQLRALREQAASTEAEVRLSREKGSRHEYRHALQLAELRREVAEVRSDTEYVAASHARTATASGGALRVLMVTSNGAGLGHLTRCLALANAFPADWSVDILTLSTGWSSVSASNARMHYFPSADRLGLSHAVWHRRFARVFATFVDELAPDVIFFDGTAVYRGIHEAARQRLIPFIWIVRGGWKPGVENDQTKHPERIADALLLPGDYAIGEELAPVATELLPVLRTPPLVYAPQVLGRQAARSALGLAEGPRYVLIQLGAGNIDDIGEKLMAAVEAVDRLGGGWTPVVVDSPITSQLQALPAHVARIVAYPLSKYYQAFEFVVAAAGYNTVQEVIRMRVPALLVPNAETLTDDQVRRASLAAASGLVLTVSNADEISDAVQQMADDRQRSSLADALEGIDIQGARPAVVPWVYDVIAHAGLSSRVQSAPTQSAAHSEPINAADPAYPNRSDH